MRRLKFIILSTFLLLGASFADAQIAKSLKISEVVVDNNAGLIDEYGERHAWVEISNTSWGTVNIRSCYLTTNRKTLEKMSVPEREKLMSLIPKGDSRTELNAKERIVFFADGQTNLGTLHANIKLIPGKENFIALFDGNGAELLDSVTVPANLQANCSYARFVSEGGGNDTWKIVPAASVTPGETNSHKGMTDNKVEEFKERDPYGIGMSILGMGIVFVCLILLSAFFYFFGKIFADNDKRRIEKAKKLDEAEAKASGALDDDNVIAAVIAMALNDNLAVEHDAESGIITIKSYRSNWKKASYDR